MSPLYHVLNIVQGNEFILFVLVRNNVLSCDIYHIWSILTRMLCDWVAFVLRHRFTLFCVTEYNKGQHVSLIFLSDKTIFIFGNVP